MKISTLHRLFSALLVATMLIGVPASMLALSVPVSAAEELIIISQSAPAIRANAGETIDLSRYRLQLAATSYVEPNQITWTSSDVTLKDNKITAPAKGVYHLVASNGSIKRDVYLVVKNPQETEYVLYENDFSDANDLGELRKVQQTSGATYSIKDGKLVMDASNSTNS